MGIPATIDEAKRIVSKFVTVERTYKARGGKRWYFHFEATDEQLYRMSELANRTNSCLNVHMPSPNKKSYCMVFDPANWETLSSYADVRQ